jgi:uncharacterized protein YkwD
MSASRTLHRARRPLIVTVLTIIVALLLTSCTEQQIDLMDRVNATRVENNLPALTPHPSAMAKAQAWAETMAADGNLRHSELSDGVTGDWLVIGENVGYSGDIATVHQAFLDSPGHRANILDARFNWIGTGYAEGADGRIWVSQVFVQY